MCVCVCIEVCVEWEGEGEAPFEPYVGNPAGCDCRTSGPRGPPPSGPLGRRAARTSCFLFLIASVPSRLGIFSF